MSKRTAALQSIYDDLLETASRYVNDNRRITREHADQLTRLMDRRKREHQLLLDRKLEITKQLLESKQKDAAEAEAEKVAAAALALNPPAIQSENPAEKLVEEKPADTLPADLKDETAAKEEEKPEDAPAEQAQEKPAETPARPATPPPAQQRQPNNGRGRHR